jgi:hypothetical protein
MTKGKASPICGIADRSTAAHPAHFRDHKSSHLWTLILHTIHQAPQLPLWPAALLAACSLSPGKESMWAQALGPDCPAPYGIRRVFDREAR